MLLAGAGVTYATTEVFGHNQVGTSTRTGSRSPATRSSSRSVTGWSPRPAGCFQYNDGLRKWTFLADPDQVQGIERAVRLRRAAIVRAFVAEPAKRPRLTGWARKRGSKRLGPAEAYNAFFNRER